MARPTARALPLLAGSALLVVAVVAGAIAGARPVVWTILGLGTVSILAGAVSLARRLDGPGAASPERAMERAERLATAGRLAAGVAHEVNNPLTGALTYTHLLLERTDLPEDVRRDLELIARSTERVREIVKRLLDFARETPIQRTPTDLNALVRETLDLVRKSAQLKGVDLVLEAAPGLPALKLDPSGMQTTVLNLVLNALDATTAGGTITVRTRPSASESTDAEYPREGVEIEVSDTGHGIAPENLERVFDPFFSTKDPGAGTGLGLSVSHGVVLEHGGTIHARSVVGSGSTFVVWIPVETDR